MAKAKRQRRTSIRTMPADNALQALEDLERAAPTPAPAAEPEGARAEPVDAVRTPRERAEE